MYSTTISRGIRSDGQLHGQRNAPPASSVPPASPAPPPKAPHRAKPLAPINLSAEQVLIGVVALLLLQSEKPDLLLILALAYILF